MLVLGTICLWGALLCAVASVCVDGVRVVQASRKNHLSYQGKRTGAVSCAIKGGAARDALSDGWMPGRRGQSASQTKVRTCPRSQRARSGARDVFCPATLIWLLPCMAPLLLTACVLIMWGALISHDVSFAYVAHNYSYSDSPLHMLFVIAGLWGGREGSLLFWAWCIGGVLLTVIVVQRGHTQTEDLNRAARMTIQIVLLAFIAILVFSPTNNPFTPIDPRYLGDDNTLVGQAALWGMNRLLEHWAMALHPPALFIGYAGMTVPFAYAVAALLTRQEHNAWTHLARRMTLVAWVFLTIGIGLGSVWAYEVLGWGGFWGWDAVENASLLSWLTSTAFLHALHAYRRHNALRVWTYVLATLTFILVILGTFITRSGLVQSVHAFAADTLSTFSFLAIMGVSALVTCVLLVRGRSMFANAQPFQSFASQHFIYLIFCIFMTASAVLVAYLTLAPALPQLLPLGGSVVGKGSFELIARPLGWVVLMALAVCPLIAWKQSTGTAFERTFLLLLCCAAVLTLPLIWVFISRLLPIYRMNIAHGGQVAQALLAQGPNLYYLTLACASLFAAMLVIVTSAQRLLSAVRSLVSLREQSDRCRRSFLAHPALMRVGASCTHLAVGLIAIGLVGSSMFVLERSVHLELDPTKSYEVGGYTLSYANDQMSYTPSGDIRYQIDLRLSRDGDEARIISPSMTAPSEMNRVQGNQLDADISSYLLEDVFVVFQGINPDSTLAVTITVNPLIRFVWAGIICLILGAVIGACAASYRPSDLQAFQESCAELSDASEQDVKGHRSCEDKIDV